MKPRPWSAPVLLCLSMLFLGVRAGSSEELQPLEALWLTEMYADGWQKVQEGVLYRPLGGGAMETFAYGAEGLEWVAQRYEQQAQLLEERYSLSPSEDLAKAVDRLRRRIDRLYQDLAMAPAAESFAKEESTDCTPVVQGSAEASPTESPQGVTATASITYEGCGQVADIFLLAKADAYSGSEHNTIIQTREPKESSITTSVSASVNGSSACESEALADVSLNGSSIFQVSDRQFGCPLSPGVSILGPAQVTTDYYASQCLDVTWEASTSDGTPPYTHSWYIDGVSAGTGPSVTKRYCGVNATVTVRVVAQDANGWTDEATTVTEVRHIGPVVASISGPASVVQNTACANVTWTAGATGGHPGYTYSWYLGTDTTVQGTGSTFTRQYCNTTQSVTVKVIARDSDGHTDDATFTTQIQVSGIEASISGPASTTTDYYDPNCNKVTWTASATGGHPNPGYNYKWYFGTSSTVVGTSSTFSKNYCPGDPHPLTVKVVVSDWDGHSDDATFTTTVQDLGIVQAQIQGPTSVATTSANPCVSVTWTASASSVGHSGFTYQWYINSSYVASGSSLTRTYCSTNQTVSVTIIARASDRHGATAGHGTTVSHQP